MHSRELVSTLALPMKPFISLLATYNPGQQLAGEIERNGTRTVTCDDVLEPVRDVVERVAPGHPLHRPLAAADHRIEQPVGRDRASRRAPIPSSTADRNWRDARIADIAAPPRPSASPARRSRRRNRHRWC